MEQIGRVVKVLDKQSATVAVRRTGACGENCAHCAGCGAEGQESRVDVKNVMGARVGDRVRLHINDGRVLLNAFLLYIVPLFVILVIGVVLSQIVPWWVNLLICAAVFVGYFVWVRMYDKRVAQDVGRNGEIIEILSTSEDA